MSALKGDAMTLVNPSLKPVPYQLDDLSKLPDGLALLIAQDRWVNWNYTWKPADQKWDKPPVGDYTDKTRWMSHARAVVNKQHDGIGFVLSEDCDIAAIDLDDIRRGDDDAEWAKPFTKKAEKLGIYIEATVSGRGARIVGRTLRTEKCTHEVKGLDGRKKCGFEIYRRRSKYITISGEGEGSASVVIDEIIDDLLRAFPERTTPKSNGHASGTLPAPLSHAPVAAAIIGEKEPAPRETQEEIDKLWSVLNHRGPDGKRVFDPDCSYGEWLDVLMAIASTGWSCATQIADAWSKQAPHRYTGGVEVKMASFTRGRNGITERSLYRKALDAGWSEPVTQQPVAPTAVPGLPAPFVQAPAPALLSDLWWHGTGTAAQTVQWLIKNVLPQTGTALISGQWGMGKTFVALDLGYSVARGNDFANYKCKRPGGVFYIAPEGGIFIPSRLAALDEKFRLDGRPLPLALLTWCPPMAQVQPPGFSLLDLCMGVASEMPKRHGVPLVLIIIDTLSAAYPFKDQNDPAEAQKVFNYLAEVSRQTGALVAAVDHYGKDTDAGTRGSSAKEASADAVLAVLGERSPAGVISKNRIAVRKARGGAQGAETFFSLPVNPVRGR